MAEPCWKLDPPHARLDLGSFNAELDLANPGAGLLRPRFRGVSVAGKLLSITARDAHQPGGGAHRLDLADCYVRQCDLVATYREAREQRFVLELYWGASQHREIPIIDLVISINTPLWELFPEVIVESSAPEAQLELAAVDPAVDCAAALLRPAGAEWSYIETHFPGDFRLQSKDVGADSAAARWLFDRTFLERGVIRRLRLRAAFVPRRDDVAHAEELHRLLLEAPLPLSA